MCNRKEKAPLGTAIPVKGASQNNQHNITTCTVDCQTKPIKDWTLQETREYCQSLYNCGDCNISNFCRRFLSDNLKPYKWQL